MTDVPAGGGTPSDPPGESTPLRIDVRRGAPSDAELAAVIAVVTEAYEREAATAVADDAVARSAWQISARSVRAPLRRDVGWGRFAG